MGFYKDGKWQPDANEIAAGEYVDNSGNSISAEHEADTLRQLVYELRRKVSVLEAANEKNVNAAYLKGFNNGKEGAESQLSAYREALECAHYALTHPASNQQFAVNAIDQALAGDTKKDTSA